MAKYKLPLPFFLTLPKCIIKFCAVEQLLNCRFGHLSMNKNSLYNLVAIWNCFWRVKLVINFIKWVSKTFIRKKSMKPDILTNWSTMQKKIYETLICRICEWRFQELPSYWHVCSYCKPIWGPRKLWSVSFEREMLHLL